MNPFIVKRGPWSFRLIDTNSKVIVAKTKYGNNIAAIIHDREIIGNTKKIREAYNEPSTLFARPSSEEIEHLLDGKIVPLYSFNEFKNGIQKQREYGVLIDLANCQEERIRICKYGYS